MNRNNIILIDDPSISCIQSGQFCDLFPEAGYVVRKFDETKPNQNRIKEYKIECEYYTIRVCQIYSTASNATQNNNLYPVSIIIDKEMNQTKKELDISKVFGGFSFHNDNWLYSIM